MARLFRSTRRKLKSKFLYGPFPILVDSLASISTRRAARKLKAQSVGRLLVDNTILAHGVTHETAWVDTGKKSWVDMEVDTGYAARIPVHSEDDSSQATRSVRYLPGIAHLARRGVIVLAISPELMDEQWTQPTGRFRGYGLFDFSLFGDLKLETIEDRDYTMVIGADPRLPSMEEQRKDRLRSKNDPLFKQLVSVLGPNNSQDAWHIATAEHHGCYCFLTMDFKLIRNVRAQAGNATLKSLRTKIITPEEFGREFHIIPISPRLYSYHNASYPVLLGANWPDSKRRGRPAP